MNLIVVESPTKARTLKRFLGSEYEIEASMGHVKDLPKSKLGVDTENNFEPDYQVLEKKKEVIDRILSLAKKAKGIYLATDPDREGEAIASHVNELMKVKSKIKRIVFHEITREAVDQAIKNPKEIDVSLVNAQIARRVLDRLVGYKLSPILWKKVRRGLSAGRVQSVTVRLIVEKEREIQAFKKEEYWEIFCDLVCKRIKNENRLTVKLIKIDSKKALVGNEKEARIVTSQLKKALYKVSDIRKREVVKHPYPPFTTSTMTQGAARLFSWSAKRTMIIAQRLYEKGLITYHRTDSTNLAAISIDKVRNFIKKEYKDKYLPANPHFYRTKSKLAQEAHEAIRPTNVFLKKGDKKIARLGNDSSKLYELIWKRFVACQMTASIYDETKVQVQANFQKKEFLLNARGSIMKFDGWKILYKSNDVDDIRLPDLIVDDVLDLIKVDPQQKFTEPPARYNEASLIKTLEQLGIGRPSTYAPIISTIQIRTYVEKKEGHFYPTPVGIAVNDFLITNFPDILDYKFTAEMEDNLDSVAKKEKKWQMIMKDFWKPFSKKLTVVEKKAKRVKIEVEKLGIKCPKCKDGEKVIRIGRFGKFISCSKFPDCDFTERYVEKVGIKCPKCKKGDVIIKLTGKKRKFFGCSNYPECKWASWKNPKAIREKSS